MENMNNVAKREMRRIDGKPDCFGQEKVNTKQAGCNHCTVRGHCTDILLGFSSEEIEHRDKILGKNEVFSCK